MTDSPWRALLGRVTAAEREHRREADRLWQAHDVIAAVRERGIADGLDQARTIHAQVIADQRAGTLEFDPLSRAMHSVWLHGDWRWLTKNMTTEEREASADAGQAYSDHLSRQDDEAPTGLSGLRWWSE
jgi:hypothetical protein